MLKAIELLVLALAYRPIGNSSIGFVAEGFSYSWGHIYNVLLYEVRGGKGVSHPSRLVSHSVKGAISAC